jgi:hypothetical protein
MQPSDDGYFQLCSSKSSIRGTVWSYEIFTECETVIDWSIAALLLPSKNKKITISRNKLLSFKPELRPPGAFIFPLV